MIQTDVEFSMDLYAHLPLLKMAAFIWKPPKQLKEMKEINIVTPSAILNTLFKRLHRILAIISLLIILGAQFDVGKKLF